MVTQFGIDVGTLLGGVIVTETVFGLAGLGQHRHRGDQPAGPAGDHRHRAVRLGGGRRREHPRRHRLRGPRPAGAAHLTRRLLFVHAHPDDETLTTGGTIAHYAAEPDTEVTLVTCTLGEEGEVIGPDLQLLVTAEADQLGGYRIAERAAACAALGVTDHRYLGGAGRWRDSGMALAGYGVRATARLAMHPRAFSAPEAFDAEVEALVAVLEEVRPQVVVSYAEDGGYGHPDHVRAHEITKAAVAEVPARLLYAVVGRGTLDAGLAALGAVPFRMPVADELPSVPDAAVTTRLDVRDQHAAADRGHAGARHAGRRRAGRAVLRHEQRRRPAGAARRGVHRGRRSPQRRPLRGRRWLRAVVVLALLVVDGVLTGAVGLAFTPLYLGAVPVPLGVLLSVLVLPWLVLRAGEVDRRFAGAPIFAWFVTIAVLGLFGPGGDALLTTTWQSLLLVFGGVGAGLWALRRVRDQPPEGTR